MYTNSETYPVASGHKADGASKDAARAVDANPDRKLRAQVESVMAVLVSGDDLIADEIGVAINETGPLYIRPIVSTLVNMGILIKSSVRKMTQIHGRPAHVIRPSADLFAFLDRHADQIEDEDDLRKIVTAFVIGRIESERLAMQIARHGAPTKAVN